jgi:hypothetical protein
MPLILVTFIAALAFLLIYCDDTLMMGPNANKLDESFKLLDSSFTVSNEGTNSEFYINKFDYSTASELTENLILFTITLPRFF